MTSKAKAIQAKINTWNYLKLKSFSTVKGTNNKTKSGRKPKWKKNIFANHISDKGLISQTCKELILLKKKKKKKKLTENRAEDIKRHFSKAIQWSTCTWKCSQHHLTIREMQVKATMMHHLMSVKWPSWRRQETQGLTRCG